MINDIADKKAFCVPVKLWTQYIVNFFKKNPIYCDYQQVIHIFMWTTFHQIMTVNTLNASLIMTFKSYHHGTDINQNWDREKKWRKTLKID